MRSEKRRSRRTKHILEKIRHRAKYISAFAALREDEDYLSLIVSRLNMLCLRHVADGQLVGRPDSIESQLRDAAANELIQRRIFGKRITPFNKNELYRYSKQKVKRLLRD